MKNKISSLGQTLSFLIVAVILIALLFAVTNLRDQKKSTISVSDQPQVLGASKSLIRGESINKNVPIEKIRDPNLVQISAKSYLVFDLETGQLLVEKNSQQKLPIASLTKLLTALIVYQSVNPSSTVTINFNDVVDSAPKLNLIVGDEIQVIDLFNAMIVGSSNDAALALSHFVTKETKKDFVTTMNQIAKALGMENSSFSNPLGFDSKQNFSTAEDLSKLVKVTQQLAAFTNLGKKTLYKFKSLLNHRYQISATNQLLNTDPSLEAIKTGFTEDAKGSIICKVTVNQRKLIFILLASNDREKDTLKLKEEVLKSFKF